MPKRWIAMMLAFCVVLSVCCTGMTASAVASSTSTVIIPITSSATEADRLAAASMEMDETDYLELKDRIHEGIMNMDEEIVIYDFSLPLSQLDNLFAVTRNFCDVFDIASRGATRTTTNILYSIRLGYSETKAERAEKTALCESVGESLIGDLKGNNLTQLEKALILHDRLAVWCEYDMELFGGNGADLYSYGIYGVLGNHVAVCQGYALCYEWLLTKLGITCRTVSSDELLHMWNIVTIGGKEYHVDVTQDDPIYDTVGTARHAYFMVSQQYMMQDANHAAYDYTSGATDTTYDDYFWNDSDTAFQLYRGTIYYLDNQAELLCSWKDGEQSVSLLDVHNYWPAEGGYVWSANFGKLCSDGRYLCFTKNDGLYRYDPVSGTATVFFQPTLSGEADAIYGAKLEDGFIQYEISDTPNKQGPTVPLLAPYRMGDWNGNGKIDASDRAIVSRYLANWIDYQAIDLSRGDVNGDGKVNVADRALLARYLANWNGYESYFE